MAGCSIPVSSSVQQINFYVQKPPDEDGIRHLQVLKPDSLAKAMFADFHCMRSLGPARELSFEEYVKLIHDLMPERELPIDYNIYLRTLEGRVTPERPSSPAVKSPKRPETPPERYLHIMSAIERFGGCLPPN